MSENETRLSMVLSGRVALYLDSIEVEMDRIRADRRQTGENA
jgi:hypothetical protein